MTLKMTIIASARFRTNASTYSLVGSSPWCQCAARDLDDKSGRAVNTATAALSQLRGVPRRPYFRNDRRRWDLDVTRRGVQNMKFCPQLPGTDSQRPGA